MKPKYKTQYYNVITNSFVGFFWRYFNTMGMFLWVFSMSSCEDFVGVELPSSQLNAEEVFVDKASAHAAIMAIYAEMRDGGIVSDLNYDLGLYADELDLYGSGTTDAEGFYQNMLSPSDRKVNQWWDGAYFMIYSANAIMENIENSIRLSKEDRDRLRGEALFVRGLVHFNLFRLYGNVPYVSTTDHIENTQQPRLSGAEIVSFVERDLLEAISLLPIHYASQDRTRPNKAVAMALLSRVYLSDQNWTGARDMATAVLGQTDLYSWQEDLDLVFLKESPSTLWQWYPKFEGNNTPEGNLFIFTTAPPNNAALTPNLVESFDTSDKRRSHWVRGVSDGENTWYHAFKYKEKGSTEPTREYSVFFRLAELYLIRSEARANLDDIEGAVSDLNKIRQRAGLSLVEPMAKELLLPLIMEERRHEFFTESGHRFFDLKRSQTLDEILSPVKTGWDTTDRLLPIPDEELLLNPNLGPQNPGY